ncbi:MAG TPA: hypothetical protein EYH16_05870 [Leucothrix mucor]|nr:hypothetical protein [Leucothrix mucor]
MEVILFETDKFNLTKEGEHFINPGCFGEDFANWLQPKLEVHKITVLDTYQEDWGWEIWCSHNSQDYYLGVGGVPDATKSTDFGEWRVMFTKKRKLTESLLGKNKLVTSEKIISIVKSILEKEKFSNISFEDEKGNKT